MYSEIDATNQEATRVQKNGDREKMQEQYKKIQIYAGRAEGKYPWLRVVAPSKDYAAREKAETDKALSTMKSIAKSRRISGATAAKAPVRKRTRRKRTVRKQ